MLLDAFTSGSPLNRTARHLLLTGVALLLAGAEPSLA
jgi:hypothetical protein